MILEARVPESEAPSAEPAKNTVMAALFTTSEIPPPPPRELAKRRRGRAEDEERAQKECREMETARRALLAEEEARRNTSVESATWASISRDMAITRGTADTTVVDQDTNEGVQTTYIVGSREPDPTTC